MFQPATKNCHYIRGRRIRIVRRPLREDWAQADPKGILILHRTLRGRDLLDHLMHEGIHFCQWDLSEEAVEEISDSLSSLVWKFLDEIYEGED